ncbi:g12413 [Coccomyxa viridis]|uniref:G12413 protein n=1 Tax=Coccomyxa viridis TaxID=1274662 RepID=A0ABP1GCX7_9CHLO
MAAGLHWFLKYACRSSVSWNITGGNNIDGSCFTSAFLEGLEQQGGMRRERSVPWHYYQNVVTPSYSMTYWSWDRWEAEIDWMALQGINLPLAFSGQEYVWQKVWDQFGLTEKDVAEHFSGPSFLAWNRMGNLRGYAGPLPQSYIDDQAVLQRRILARMRSFGMTPVFPAFAGFVPAALAAQRPELNIVRSENWCNFPDQYCCVHLLDPLEPVFQDIGSAFIKALRDVFGSDSVSFYAADTFNEMKPPTDNPTYLTNVTTAIYKAMATADPQAKWLMQAWLFYDKQEFWKPPQIKALVTGVPKGALVMLDLYAEVSPLWKATESFYGADFIFCMLHNFGGNIEMYGALPAVAHLPQEPLQNSSGMIGIGMCPEGIEQNPIVYDLMSEWAFRREPVPLGPWVADYARRRYGPSTPEDALKAWALLLGSVYNATDSHTDHSRDIPTSRPGLTPFEIGLWGLRPQLWYNPDQVVEAWGLLLQSAPHLGTVQPFLYDLVDVGRQVLSKLATAMWNATAEEYTARAAARMQAEAQRLLELLDDLEELLATHSGFLLGPRLAEARAAGHTSEESGLYEWNLRTQLSVWGTSPKGGSEVEDYANREWAGLISSYYKPRWQAWLNRLREDLEDGRMYDAEEWRMDSLSLTLNWAHSRDELPQTPHGNSVEVSKRLFGKYAGTGADMSMLVNSA